MSTKLTPATFKRTSAWPSPGISIQYPLNAARQIAILLYHDGFDQMCCFIACDAAGVV